MSGKDASEYGTEQKKHDVVYVPVDYMHNAGDDEDKIDLFELIKTVWDGRRLVLKTIILFILIGLFVAFTSISEYTSEVRVLPEAQQGSSLGPLGGLASQFGFSAGVQRSADGIPPSIYPDITRSNMLLYRLLDYELLPQGFQQPVTVREYMAEYQKVSFGNTIRRYTIRLPFTLRDALFQTDTSREIEESVSRLDSQVRQNLIQMNRDEWEMIRNLRDRIVIETIREGGVVTLSVRMQDPLAAAQVADYLVHLLSDYITEYRTEKARSDVLFIEERFEEARVRFEEAQQELARFHDANRGQLSAMARTEEQLLQNNFNLTFNLYNTLAERLEDARIKLQEETPVVNILEPAVVPDRRSEPKRAQLLIIYTILGGITGVLLLFFKQVYATIKDRIITT